MQTMGSEGWLAFTAQLVRGRWFVFFASLLVMVNSGSTYLFGTYSLQMKTKFRYSQTRINTLGFFKDLGSSVGIISGFLSEIAPTWSLFLLGSTTNFISYFVIWLAASDRIAQPAFWQICIFIAVAANSANFPNTAVLVSCARNFPERRGIVLGLLKGFVGLSGAVLTQLYFAFHGNDQPISLILFLGYFPSMVTLVFVLTIRRVKIEQKQPNEITAFYQFLYLSIVLALFIMVLGLTEKQVAFSNAGYVGGALVVITLLFLPLFIAIREERFFWNTKQNHVYPSPSSSVVIHEDRPFRPAKMNSFTQQPEETSFLSRIMDKPERGEDYTVLQAIFSKDMLFLILATLCGTGSTITAIDNLGQVGESLKYPALSISFILSLLSIWNFFGRVLSGFISETLLAKYKFPRPLLLSIVLLISCTGLLAIAFPFSHSVYLASLIIGFTFGAQVTLLYSIISELFGLEHFAMLFSCMQLSVPIGSYILNVEVIGFLYDTEASKAGHSVVSSEKGISCIGAHCFSLGFTILAATTFLGAISSLILAMRTKEYYGGDIYKRFKEDLNMPKSEMEFYCFDMKNNKEATGYSKKFGRVS